MHSRRVRFSFSMVAGPLLAPNHCRYALAEVTTARRTAVVRHFIEALTRGGPGGSPRPIELNSHDPLRYARLCRSSFSAPSHDAVTCSPGCISVWPVSENC
jgi:hypothetical protein